MLSDDIFIAVGDGSGHHDGLSFPTREDIDILPRIRVGKSLIDLIDDYVTASWKNPHFYQTTGTFVEGHPKNVPNQKRQAIVKLMQVDFKNFLREVLPYRAQNIIEDRIRERAGQRDLSQLTDEEYETHFRTVAGEEREKYFTAMKQMASWMRGDPRGAGSSFDSYIQPWAFFNLYLSVAINRVSDLTDRLWGQEKYKDTARLKEFNEALRLLFLEVYGEAIKFNPLGIVGGSSFETAPKVMSDSRKAFYPSTHPEAIIEVYSSRDSRTEEQIKGWEPAFGDAAVGKYDKNPQMNPQRIITLQTLMDIAFGYEKTEHRSDLWANPSGAVLVLREVGKRYAHKTVFEDYVEPKTPAAFGRLPRGFLTA